MLARLVLALALLLAFGPVAPSAMAAGKGAARAPARQELQARIARVDEAQREIVLDAADATTQVKVAKDAKIMINGTSATLGDLKGGEEVRASLDRSGGDVQVVRIEVVGKAK
jgi:Cu/Ag efflux protein CusF